MLFERNGIPKIEIKLHLRILFVYLTGFARTYFSKVSVFPQEPYQKRSLQGSKGIKFTPKRSAREKEERGERRKTSVPMGFIPSTLEKEVATCQHGENRPILCSHLLENPVRYTFEILPQERRVIVTRSN